MSSVLKNLNPFNNQINRLREKVNASMILATQGRYYALLSAINSANIAKIDGLEISTNTPIAFDSADHTHPLGAVKDVTHCPPLANWARLQWGKDASLLDLGCAGEGLIFDFTWHGLLAVGVDGSDAAKNAGHGFWPYLGDRLFTADITAPFRISRNGNLQTFNLVTAWEVLEHIEEGRVSELISNVSVHLKKGGVFLASVASFPDLAPDGTARHVNFNPIEWWYEKFAEQGLHQIELPPLAVMSRGSGNPTVSDWNRFTHPELGFHLAVRKP